MIWEIFLAVLAALLFLMFYKPPVNRVHVPPPPPAPPVPDGHAPAPEVRDLNDLYGSRRT